MIRIVECSICSRPKRENLMLMGRNICKECEDNILQSDAGDLYYPLYLEKVKDIIKPVSSKETS